MRQSLQLRELVVVPGWHRHPLSGAPSPLWQCLPGPDREGPLWSGHRTQRCSPPWARRCTVTACPVPPPCFTRGQQVGFIAKGGTAMGVAVHRPNYPESSVFGARLGWHRHPLSSDQLVVGRSLGHHHPLSGDRTALSGALAESSSKE